MRGTGEEGSRKSVYAIGMESTLGRIPYATGFKRGEEEESCRCFVKSNQSRPVTQRWLYLQYHRYTPHSVISGDSLCTVPRRPSVKLTREHRSVGNYCDSSSFCTDLSIHFKHNVYQYTRQTEEVRKIGFFLFVCLSGSAAIPSGR